MGYYKNLDILRQESEYDAEQIEAHEFAADCSEELRTQEEERDTLRSPPPGSWAETAREMAKMFPDEDWDAWKEEMKEQDL